MSPGVQFEETVTGGIQDLRRQNRDIRGTHVEQLRVNVRLRRAVTVLD